MGRDCRASPYSRQSNYQKSTGRFVPCVSRTRSKGEQTTMSYSEEYKGYTIKGKARAYRVYDASEKRIRAPLSGFIRQQVREYIDKLITYKGVSRDDNDIA
jgi:hypothetical protein